MTDTQSIIKVREVSFANLIEELGECRARSYHSTLKKGLY